MARCAGSKILYSDSCRVVFHGYNCCALVFGEKVNPYLLLHLLQLFNFLRIFSFFTVLYSFVTMWTNMYIYMPDRSTLQNLKHERDYLGSISSFAFSSFALRCWRCRVDIFVLIQFYGFVHVAACHLLLLQNTLQNTLQG